MANAKESLLHLLPPELRNAIYDEVFRGCVINIDKNGRAEHSNEINFMLTAKQVYNEAIEIYYSNVLA